MAISSVSELEWSLLSFATSHSTSRSFKLTGREFKKEKTARKVGGDYLREAIISNISVYGRRFF